MYKKYGRRPAGRRPRKTAPRRTRVPRKKGMVRLIKKTVNRMAETKITELYTATTLANYTAATSWNTNNVVTLSPNAATLVVQQGTGQAQRLGNKIQTVRCWVNFVMYPAAYNAVSNPNPIPQHVRIIICNIKNNPQAVITQSPYMSVFFQNAGTATPPGGQLLDLLRDVNTDYFRVYYDKVIKLGAANYIGTGANATYGGANNDFKLNVKRTIDITKFIPKTLTFNDNGGIAENMKNVQMIILPCGADNFTNNLNPLSWAYALHYTYKDF